MGNVEFSLIKSSLWAVRDWDGFQLICRRLLRLTATAAGGWMGDGVLRPQEQPTSN